MPALYFYNLSILYYNVTMEQHALKKRKQLYEYKLYSYLDTSGGQSSNPYFNVVHFLNTIAD